jgi:phosphoribosylformylglycinamidine synthase
MRGYHKPIMIAGGLGSISDATQTKKIFPAGTLLVQLGGPGMRIGMGGGAASSMAAGATPSRAGLRLGAARQPRDPAPRAGGHQPLLGAGRAQPDPGDPRRGRRRPEQRLPRAGRRRGRGARFDLREGAAGRERPGTQGDLVQREPGTLRAGDAPVARRCSSACANASAARLRWSAWRPTSAAAAGRRREATGRHADGRAARQAAQDAPRRARVAQSPPLDLTASSSSRCAFDVLRHPTVASKRFLITIGDRTWAA